MTVHPGNQVDAGPRNGPPDSPERERRREEQLGVWRRVAFFVNPTAGSPVGGAKEICVGAASAGVTLAAFNIGDGGKWRDWPFSPGTYWARCDTRARLAMLDEDDVANVESPEINDGTCTPAAAVDIVGPHGAVITEATVPHADWTPVAAAGMPVFIEIDPNVPKVRDVGVQGLVDYGRQVVGSPLVFPAFFVTQNAWWDGRAETFATYWDHLREQYPGDVWALYAAENVPDWSVVR